MGGGGAYETRFTEEDVAAAMHTIAANAPHKGTFTSRGATHVDGCNAVVSAATKITTAPRHDPDLTKNDDVSALVAAAGSGMRRRTRGKV